MTLRLILGCDPGQAGCVSALADDQPAGFIDMPTVARHSGNGKQVNAVLLARQLRDLRAQHPGAYTCAVLECVGAMPRQGVSSVFKFGDAYGTLKGVLGALEIPVVEVRPDVWKRYMRLTGRGKDAARAMAISLYPSAAHQMARVKDDGRAEGLLLARWGTITEAVGARAA